VVIEVALALVLLVGAGLLLRSFARILSTDPGFSADHVMTAQLTLPAAKYDRLAKRTQFWDDLLQRIRVLPGVTSAGTVSFLPMNGLGSATGFEVVGQPKPAPGQGPGATIKVVDGDYFAALGIPLRRGRLFTEAEQQTENRHAIISETLARRFFPNQDPIGQHLLVSWYGEGADEIIGVVGDTKMVTMEEEMYPAIYYPYSRTPYSSNTIVVRTAGSPSLVASSLVQAVHQIDPDLPVSNLRSMDDVIARSMAQRRIVMVLLAVFAAVALLLATVGIYGVMSYMVSQRTQEIGIRMALGADRGEVVGMVLVQALRLAAGGLAAGCIAAFALTGLLRTMLYDVRPTDPITFAGVAAVLLAVAAVATAVPAMRATRIDPLMALKAE